jgi:pimeloyl-ACP methyl ester carboxylesterase
MPEPQAKSAVEIQDEEAYLRSAALRARVSYKEMRTPVSRQIKVNGVNLHFLEWESPGPTVLFLHGGGLNAHTWDVVCLNLASKYRCIALDQRGHGDSDWDPEGQYSLERHASDLREFVTALGLKDLLIVGHSMGGLNAIMFASEFTQSLKGLVLVESGPDPRDDGAKRILDFLSLPPELDSIESFVERALTFSPNRDPMLLRTSLQYNLRQLPNGKWTWKYDNRRSSTPEDRARNFQVIQGRLPLIACPTLFIRGGRSDVFRDEDAARITARLPLGSWVTVPDAGHSVQSENARDLSFELRRFFEATPRGNYACGCWGGE